jgi:hypothetical protein
VDLTKDFAVPLSTFNLAFFFALIRIDFFFPFFVLNFDRKRATNATGGCIDDVFRVSFVLAPRIHGEENEREREVNRMSGGR